MAGMMRDNSSEMQKKFQSIACEAVAKLRDASDKGEIVTPNLVGQVKQDVQKVLEQIHYGFHEKLMEEWKQES